MTLANDPRAAQRLNGRFAYAIAVVAVLAAAGIRWLLNPVFGDTVPYITFFLGVTIAAWYGGTRPALLAAVVGAFLARILFIPPRFSLALESGADLVSLLVFLANCVAIAYLGGKMRTAEQVARRRESLLKVTLTSIGDAVVTTDVHEKVTMINSVGCQLTGWSESEAIGRSFREIVRLINEETREPVENPVSKVLSEGRVIGLANHTIPVARDGTELSIDDSAAPIRDAQGVVVGVVLVFRDVTERNRDEMASRRLAAIIESSDDAIIAKNLDGIITSWNQGAERIFGYTSDEVVGQPILRLIPGERAAEEKDILDRLRRGERIEHYETVRIAKDGRMLDISLSIAPLRDAKGNVVGASKIARDITAPSKRTSPGAKASADFRRSCRPCLVWPGSRINAAVTCS